MYYSYRNLASPRASPSAIDSGRGCPSVSGSIIDERPAVKAAMPKKMGACGPSSKMYGAKMVPMRLMTKVNPTPTPLTAVGNCSAENRLRMV